MPCVATRWSEAKVITIIAHNLPSTFQDLGVGWVAHPVSQGESRGPDNLHFPVAMEARARKGGTSEV